MSNILVLDFISEYYLIDCVITVVVSCHSVHNGSNKALVIVCFTLQF